LNDSAFPKPRAERLRAVGRIVIFFVLLLVGVAVAIELEGIVERGFHSAGYRPLIVDWSQPLGVLLATWVCVRLIDRRPWDFVLLGRSAARPSVIGLGALVGAVAIGLPSVILLSVGQLRAVQAPDGSWLFAAAVTFANLLPSAAGEELFIRGYLFAVMRETIGWRWTLILTSIVFGLMHTQNPGADAESVVLVMLAGFFLGSILLATRSLYAAIAVHFAWNWMMAAGLHTPVSGIPIIAPDYRVVDNGPDWLTGGAWGPEGGFAAAVSMFVAVIYIYSRHLRRMEQ
jgi:membrane protease YdiL (CAAX protease family)